MRSSKWGWFLIAGCCLLLLLPSAIVANETEVETEVDPKADIAEFFQALVEGDNETVTQFIEAGVDVNAPIDPVGDDYGFVDYPPLVWAFFGGIDTTRLLLDAGAGINEPQDIYGLTPWHYALRSDIGASPEIVRLLLDEGADLEARTRGGDTPVRIAVISNESEKVGILLQAGADPDATDKYERTTLALILDEGPFFEGSVIRNRDVRLEMTRLLLEAGADPNSAATPTSRSPLMNAVRGGYAPIVELLLRFGAEIDATDDSGGRTALHWAVEAGMLQAVQVLVEAGADLEIEDRNGATPLTVARRYRGGNAEELVRYLADAVAGE